MSELKMPRKGQSAVMLQDLNAEHASSPIIEVVESDPHTSGPDEVASLDATKLAKQQEAKQDYSITTQATKKKVSKLTNLQPADETSDNHSQPASADRDERSSPSITSEGPETTLQRPEEQRQAVHTDQREQRFRAALERARQDDVTVVSVRISVRLNAYMDDYVARLNRLDPKRKYKKQDAVAEAFAAFYADHPMPVLADDDNL